jgi:type IV secretion system protein VirB11
VTQTAIYLSHFLEPLQPWLGRPHVTDIYINKPKQIWLETLGGAMEEHHHEALNEQTLLRLSRQVAAYNSQGINRAHPLLAGALPDGTRVQLILPPATRGNVAMAFRRHVTSDRSLRDYAEDNAFPKSSKSRSDTDILSKLRSLQARGHYFELLQLAVQSRQNILISGGTSTGKTTFLNALLKEIDPSERLIFIEDTPELTIHHENAVSLIAARNMLGEANIDMEDLLVASLRMRPDRIILGELRGPEAFTFLRAVNTGHPGSMTTIHADNPARAIEQMVMLILQSGSRLDRDAIIHYVKNSIDVYVQLDRIAGKRRISDVRVRE